MKMTVTMMLWLLQCLLYLEDAEANLENEEIDEEINDALDEGYMGMECTVERGFSLNESAIGKTFHSDLYDEMTIHYVPKSFPKKYSSAVKDLILIRKQCKSFDCLHLWFGEHEFHRASDKRNEAFYYNSIHLPSQKGYSRYQISELITI